ncbi:MAG: DNA endonuclease SmrA [Halioglobus sp.]|nr:DNA endonuclease SmrA [Halioglobus sp.]
MQGDDDSLFRSQMTDVEPLKREPRVARRRGSSGGDAALGARREAAVREAEADRNMLRAEGIAPLDAWFVLSFKRPGVQNGVFRKLRQGRYEPLARLDLHRFRVEQARREVFDFIRECHDLGLRSVIVIHGKGDSRAGVEQRAILKGCVDHWLRELEVVQAFHSAQPAHGGTGAVYVLLKKSEAKKQETRDQFTRGRAG